ncbi:MAG: bifunctional 5,10-methylenetetrahydrofolate dehydrogenase/5,10-methenyltetrahydrofolate cyclohydrolase [Candidatus Pacebacteria bacterium]|nr:bifunctional 5,10-methylenetetrahydrofolate dehydrogenase/5,10-methenyltetrahydrofolate cyclohydrolase [Candidatus Paceibacterota bacterium]
MSPLLLDGRVVRAARLSVLAERVKQLQRAPKLAIVQVGDRADSAAYIRAKKAFAERIGVQIDHVHFVEGVSEQEIVETLARLNVDSAVDGIIVQLPLSAHLDSTKITNTIDPHKDVDGLTDVNQALLSKNDLQAIIPATARGVKELLEYYEIGLKGKKVAVVGRSRLVGTPIAHMCAHAGAEVIVCHSKTPDLAHETRGADIVIVAVGKPGLIGAAHIKPGAVVVDVGINRIPDGSLKGDVDFETVKDVVSAITPVPGGVGQMTVLALFENLLDTCKM